MQPIEPPEPPEREAYDAADPEKVKKAEKAAKLRTDQRRAVEAALLSTVQGREWVWHILMDCRVWEKRLSMTGDSENAFYEGQREVGLQLLRLFARHNPDLFARMVKENDA